ncbi:Retrotransposable element Tf2 protein [Rhizoctonia solani]|uniref:Retrotransposable element Tf2 protein n=1 Tax=Rhizoctonia solani TaxID=456999 RepID=A0A8H8NP85_9AGAM|nr:Retrotransposable element Tf2 protein [Rhizoctonia solani]QRW16915.1 Retrotransposable element Tf2 protein [Rhizoctonia solani]
MLSTCFLSQQAPGKTSHDFIVKFPKCKGYDSILVVVDHFSKMMHLVPCKETATAEDVPQMFLEHVWKLHALYKSLQITPGFSTAYHPQSDGQTEIKNQLLEAYLHALINHRQPDWIVYGRSPVISPLLEPTGLPIADDRAKQLAETIQEADTGKPPPESQPGDKFWLLASNIMLQRLNKKLDHKQYGPFPVIETVGSHAYCLALPETMKIHDVFHVSLLSAFKQDTEFDCTFTPLPPVITAEGEEEVRWKGYAPHEDTWEPAKDLQRCKDKLRNFFANYPDAPATNNPIPANARKVKRGKMLSLPKLALLSSSCAPHYPSMPTFSSINALAYDPCLNIDCYIMNGPEEMRAHLDSSANIIHALMSASSCNKVRFFKRNVYKHPKWGFLYWLDPRGEEGLDTLYGKQVYRWWHFIASHPVSTPPICKGADPGNAEPHSALPSGPTGLYKQASNASDPSSMPRHSRPTEAHAPAPLPFPLFSSTPDTCWTPGYSSPVRETQWEPQSYLGWGNEEIRRNVETFEGRKNEELFSFEELLAIDCSEWM